MQGGWIKINREIVNHWLWSDAERLKWWLDLLFMANWDDKKVLHDSHLFTLKRGQIIASVAFLCERWEKSKMTVLKFLQMLEGEEMIKREILYRQTPIITICNSRFLLGPASQLAAEARCHRSRGRLSSPHGWHLAAHRLSDGSPRHWPHAPEGRSALPSRP